MAAGQIKPGIYNTEYYSGSQCAVYIGDVWVDEITSINYQVNQGRAPLYGYADTLFRDVSKGKVFIQGTFTINFKEAGYLFLILDRYRRMMRNLGSVMGDDTAKKTGSRSINPFKNSGLASRQTIEAVLNNTTSTAERNRILNGLAEYHAKEQGFSISTRDAWASLSGYPTTERASTAGTAAENPFENFEDAVWGRTQESLDEDTRRADDSRLSPFDIYLSFGDFAADNSANHTIQKLSEVFITGSAKEVIIDGQPIQEMYTFIARNIV